MSPVFRRSTSVVPVVAIMMSLRRWLLGRCLSKTAPDKSCPGSLCWFGFSGVEHVNATQASLVHERH